MVRSCLGLLLLRGAHGKQSTPYTQSAHTTAAKSTQHNIHTHSKHATPQQHRTHIATKHTAACIRQHNICAGRANVRSQSAGGLKNGDSLGEESVQQQQMFAGGSGLAGCW